MSTNDRANEAGPSAEELKWAETKEMFGSERLLLGPYFSFIAMRTPRRLLHLLSYYKFAAKMIGSGARTLDIGCSEGLGTVILAEQASRCVGVDIDAPAIEVAASTLSTAVLTFQCADILTGPVGSFDAVTTFDVIEHIYPENEDAFLAAVCANLVSHGVALIGTPNVTSDQYASPHTRAGHVNLYSAERLRNACRRYFDHVFMFSANDEMVHTGFSPLAHYLIALCAGVRQDR